MAELKTKVTEQSISDFLMQITDEGKRNDCFEIAKLMEEVSGAKGKMWGTAILGFGDHTYYYANGKPGDWFMMGFSPRKTNISLYILGCEASQKEEILSRFGKHKSAKGCVYINKLSDINIDVLKEMCELSYQTLKK